jgi:hypothetical protein
MSRWTPRPQPRLPNLRSDAEQRGKTTPSLPKTREQRIARALKKAERAGIGACQHWKINTLQAWQRYIQRVFCSVFASKMPKKRVADRQNRPIGTPCEPKSR